MVAYDTPIADRPKTDPGSDFSGKGGERGAGFCGAQGRNRTTDTRIFSPLLYRLSYLGEARIKAARPGHVKTPRGCGTAGSWTGGVVGAGGVSWRPAAS